MNRHFVLLFENNVGRKRDRRYFLPTVDIKYYNVMIGGKNLFDQPVIIIIIISNNIYLIISNNIIRRLQHI